MEISLYSQKLSFCDEICAFMESRGIQSMIRKLILLKFEKKWLLAYER